jgi:hypothetical protein
MFLIYETLIHIFLKIRAPFEKYLSRVARWYIIFLNIKSLFGYVLKCLRDKRQCWYTMSTFGSFYTLLICCANKHLATLYLRPDPPLVRYVLNRHWLSIFNRKAWHCFSNRKFSFPNCQPTAFFCFANNLAKIMPPLTRHGLIISTLQMDALHMYIHYLLYFSVQKRYYI